MKTGGREVTPVPALAGARAYKVPPHPAPMDLMLHGNEGAAPPPEVFRAINLSDTELVRRYPNPCLLEAALAERHGVLPEQVVVTAGGDDGLDRAFRAFLCPEREVILPRPTFVMMSQYARHSGARVVAIEWPGGDFPGAEVEAAVTPATGAIVLVSPNNPTGATIDSSQIVRLSQAAPHAALLVDLAYGEFADHDLWPTVKDLPNAIGFGTFSKAWGLAGIRVGYAIGPTKLIDVIRAAGNPYAVSGLSLALAHEWLVQGHDHMLTYVAAARRERNELQQVLDALGAEAQESQGNFVFARLTPPPRAAWLSDALAGLGIRIRAFPTKPRLADAVRITCPGDEAKLKRVIHALKVALAPERILVDAVAGASWRPPERSNVELVVTGLGKAAAHFTEPDAARTWCVSGRPETLLQARAAGHLPIGLDSTKSTPGALYKAGAGMVISQLDELQEMLP